MPTKKMPTLRGRKAGKCAVRMPDNFTLVMPIGNDSEVADRYFKFKPDADASSIAHPARPTVRTARNGNHRRNAPVHHHAGAILRTKPKGPVIETTLKSAVYPPPKAGFCFVQNFAMRHHAVFMVSDWVR